MEVVREEEDIVRAVSKKDKKKKKSKRHEVLPTKPSELERTIRKEDLMANIKKKYTVKW